VVLEMAGQSPMPIRTGFDSRYAAEGVFLCWGLTLEADPLNFSGRHYFQGHHEFRASTDGGCTQTLVTQMTGRCLTSGRLDLRPVITDRLPMKNFAVAHGSIEDRRG